MCREPMICKPKSLPQNQLVEAAKRAQTINPVNAPSLGGFVRSVRNFNPTPLRLAALTSKYWGSRGVTLTVGYLDNPPYDLQNRILSHLNAWSAYSNVKFEESQTDPQVRISRDGGPDGGFWSYMGTDILSIDNDRATMNLEGFTMQTEDAEFFRVVRHEAGHTLGFPHEHMRRQLVNKIDPKKAIKYFKKTDGWSPEEVKHQVLTPLEVRSIMGTEDADETSIMCYHIPGEITKNGDPILGGKDLSKDDKEFVGLIYPIH